MGLLYVSGCGDTPARPSRQLAVQDAPDVLLVGETAPLVAVDRATGQTVNAEWSSSQPAVASVLGAQVTGIGAGRATITAAFDGTQASASVKVVPSFAGTYPSPPDFWGEVFKVDCVDIAGNYCRSNVANPELFRMQVTQVKDTVSARVQIPFPAAGTLTGTVDDLGRLSLSGTLLTLGSGNFPGGTPARQIESWASYLDASGAMWGTYTWTSPGSTGAPLFRVSQEMRGLTHAR